MENVGFSCLSVILFLFLLVLKDDIWQETKLSRQELSADVTMAEGYEAFVSCTRTSNKGRTGYSGKLRFILCEQFEGIMFFIIQCSSGVGIDF